MKCAITFSFLFLVLCLMHATAQSPTLVLQKGHLRKVNSARFSPDGKQMVTTSDDGLIKIWDAFSQKLVTELGGNGAVFIDASFSADGKDITAIARRPLGLQSNEGKEGNNIPFYVWEIESGRLLYADADGYGIATLSPDSKWIAVHPDKMKTYQKDASWKTVADSPINIYEASTSKLFKKITRYEDTTTGAEPFISFTSDSTLLIAVHASAGQHLFITKYTVLNFLTDIEVASYNDTTDFYKSSQWLMSPGRNYLFHYGGEYDSSGFTELWDVQHLKRIWNQPIAMASCSFNKNDSAMLMMYNVVKPLPNSTFSAPQARKFAHFILKDTMRVIFPENEYDMNVVSTNGNEQLFYATAEMQITSKDTICRMNIYNDVGKVVSHYETKNPVIAMTFSPNDKFLVTGHNDGNLVLWDFTDTIAKEVTSSINEIDPLIQIHTSSASQKVGYITKSMFGMQDAKSINKLSFISPGPATIRDVHYLLKDKYSILDVGDEYKPNGNFLIINNDTPSVVKNTYYDATSTNDLLLGSDFDTAGKNGENNKYIKLNDRGLKSFSVYTTLTDINNPQRPMMAPTVTLMSGILNSGKIADTTLLIAAGSTNLQYNDKLRSYVFTYDVPYAIRKAKPKDVVHPLSLNAKNLFLPEPTISDDGRYLLGRHYTGTMTDPNFYYCQDLQSNLIFKTPITYNSEKIGAVKQFIISPDKKLACILSDPLFSSDASSVRVINTQNGAPVYNLKMNIAGVVNGATYTSDSKYVYTWCEGGTLNKWNLTNGQNMFTMVFFKDHDYAIILPEGYYFISSRTDAKYLNFKLNNKLYNFSQFDLQFNRPDKVLQAIGSNDKGLIGEYYKAWQGRIKKNGFAEKDFNSKTLHVPSVLINSNNIQPFTAEQQQSLSFTVSDSLYNIRSYNVFINDVPVNGINGKQLANASHGTTITQTVLLSEGMNKIEMNCTNENAAVSRKEAVYVTYAPDKPAAVKTYFIGIGINNYSAHSSFVDLSYCVKDIRDLSNALKQKIKEDIVIDTLMNERATKENILALKRKLMNTTVNDRVIVSFSGHGMVDPQHPDDFYFVTGNTDVNDPSINGVSYAQLEELLDSIPARKKLMLLDACHSGESDGGANNSVGSIPGTKKGNDDADKSKAGSIEILDVVENNDPSQKSSTDIFKLMKEAFVDIRRNNGAYVLSAAQSNESAGEGGGITNGWFTSCIISQIQQYSSMSINDLSTKVNQCVSAKSGGNQNTDNRQELAEFNWLLW